MPDDTIRSNNPKGTNQHGESISTLAIFLSHNQFIAYLIILLVQTYPNLRSVLQDYSNQRMSQAEMLRRLSKNHGIEMKSALSIYCTCNDRLTNTIRLRTLQRSIKQLDIRTPRRNGLTEIEMGMAIDQELEEDPLGRWGFRKVQEKLGLQGIHIPR